nr:hypothetical protein [Tanacetum cinerariifolium]
MAWSGIGLEDVQTCYHTNFMLSMLLQSNVYTHPITILSDSDVEDALFSINTPGYSPASPDYSPASPRNTASDSKTESDPSEDLFEDHLTPLAISPFYDDPYMKVMQAYNATSNESPIPPPQAPIAPPTILPPSTLFNL